MINFAFAGLAILAQPVEWVEIPVTGREMVGLRDYEHVIRGTCDGRPASLTIILATRETPGRLVLRAGPLQRELPPTFLDAALVANGLYYTGLACDGRRLKLSGEAVRDGGSEIVLVRQNATLDMDTGELSLTELKRFSPAETRSELTRGREFTIDDTGRLTVPSGD